MTPFTLQMCERTRKLQAVRDHWAGGRSRIEAFHVFDSQNGRPATGSLLG
jgi:hypothetical protein